ncbi:MAG: response regulator transcription factor [Thiofilum sp.]|uniref:response regulator transcription factor n=1 Tax=Thiofilum sp. TaxID=2212733 RepID=UPI0025D07140|nr:response regulator transcription factor [Thiofilum sp.]MBK8452565.1 response regulator transcription factor [Thiofilum sp.]
MYNALIVEDTEETSIWLKKILETAFAGIKITICTNCAETRTFIQQNTISLALVDINLPDGSGLDLITEIRQLFKDAYIITTTIFDDDDHILTALRNGANGYLLKDLAETIFIQKLRGILTGDPPLSPSIARKILHCFAESANKPSAVSTNDNIGNNHIAPTLSPREQDVLILVAKGFSRKEIAELLHLSSNTVARYIRDVYQKLNISSRAEAAVEACRMGLVGTEM